ncbi:DNA polymerase epsilon subunit be [Anaeramoeba ignava]|uniref:DNA polymerase II subunit 2 n=1 Tax=Anaeramoeba ignava TaxID=1746090 RepID=A0A9Q0LT36_ANAIG|nr:DNA polymerase epsilon subunit be [Anaeramoeba ignava]
MDQFNLRKKILEKLKIRGFSIRPNAMKQLIDFIFNQNIENISDSTDLIIEEIVQTIITFAKEGIKQQSKNAIIDLDIVTKIITKFQNQDTKNIETENLVKELSVISALNHPKYSYSNNLNGDLIMNSQKINDLLGDSNIKTNMFIERFEIVRRRLERNSLFSNNLNSFQLTPVNALLGLRNQTIVCGMIYKLEDGGFYLEDKTGTIKLNLENTNITTGVFTETCIVLVEGYCEGDAFIAETLGFPPCEKREETIKALGYTLNRGGLEMFDSQITIQDYNQIIQIEKDDLDKQIIFVSEINFDQQESFDNLDLLFQGFNVENCPSMFVLIGNFTKSIFRKVAKTILDQGHLSPFPLHIKPIICNLDHSLRLFPTPHSMVLCDNFDTFEGSYEGCHYFNPGLFSIESSFVVYYPLTDEVEFSRIKK